MLDQKMTVARIFRFVISGLILTLTVFNLAFFGQSRNVTVTSGSLSGNTLRERQVNIWANPAPSGQIFDKWVGDIALLRDPFEYHSRVNALSKNINLTATYKNAAVWTQTEFVLGDGTRWGYYFPSNHVAVIFRFHGTNGNQGTLWNSAEDRDFANQAVAAGYALVSGKNVNGSHWDAITPPVTNLDYANVNTVITTLQQQGLMRLDDKVFALGFSNGGTFASYVAHHKSWRAAALYCSAGLDSWMFSTTVPHSWNIMINDTRLEPGAIPATYAHLADLSSRGITAQHRMFYPTPVFPNRFWRIQGLTSADSQLIYSALKNNGFLDVRDFLIQNPSSSNWQAVIPVQYAAYSNQIENQLQVCYAEHNFFADANYRVLQFFNSRL